MRSKKSRIRGFVSLVGAGPGDPKLLTLRGKEALEACDVVIYDHLVHPGLLNHAPRAKHIYVGKKGGDPDSTPQRSIESLMVRLARFGKRIVRLKGGDPFVFGRGGEELLYLSRNQIPFEVIPGVTAGIAGPAYAGIPVTHRGLASEVTLLTAHEDPSKGKSDLNWKALAQLKGTLVLYMGMKTLPETVKWLIKYGKDPRTPVSVIQWGTTAEQEVVTGTLDTIVEKARAAHMTPPVVTVIGKVNRLRSRMNWFEQKPLFGTSVLVTRSRRQASQLGEALEALGARVIELPTIDISPVQDFSKLDRAICGIHRFDWLVFTSENGVEAFFKRLRDLKKDARILSRIKIAVIGPGTKSKLNSYSIDPDLIPSTFTTKGLLKALNAIRPAKKRFLLLRTNIAPDDLRSSLIQAHAFVEEIPIYRTNRPKGLAEKVDQVVRSQKIDYMTFTSSSTARNFFESLRNGRHLNAKVVSIGPVTTKTLRDLGIQVDRQARVPTIQGLVEAVLEEVVG